MRLANPRLLTWAIVILMIVGLVTLFITQHQAFTLATTRQPERLTELFFADPTHIPTNVTQGQPLNVSFVVHNLESQTMSYPYTITFTDAQGVTTPLGDGTTTLPDSAAQNITKQVTVPVGDGRGEITVQLPTKKQSIHFWVQRQGA